MAEATVAPVDPKRVRVTADRIHGVFVEAQLFELPAGSSEAHLAPLGVRHEHDGDHPCVPGKRSVLAEVLPGLESGLDDSGESAEDRPVARERFRAEDPLILFEELSRFRRKFRILRDIEEGHFDLLGYRAAMISGECI